MGISREDQEVASELNYILKEAILFTIEVEIKKLEIYQSIIEKDTSEKLNNTRNWGQKWARLYIEYPSGNITEDFKKLGRSKSGSLR